MFDLTSGIGEIMFRATYRHDPPRFLFLAIEHSPFREERIVETPALLGKPIRRSIYSSGCLS